MPVSKQLGALGFAIALSACVVPTPKTTSLRIKGAPADASVTLDDRYLGTFAYVASKGVALPPGKHRLTVEKVGFFPWDRMLEAPDAGSCAPGSSERPDRRALQCSASGPPIQLDVALVQIPD